MRCFTEVPCHHSDDCFGGGRYGKGYYVDDLSNVMGGNPRGECRCMTDAERLELAIERHGKRTAATPPSPLPEPRTDRLGTLDGARCPYDNWKPGRDCNG